MGGPSFIRPARECSNRGLRMAPSRISIDRYAIGVIHPGSALRDPAYRSMLMRDGAILKPLLEHSLAGRMKDGPPNGYEPQ